MTRRIKLESFNITDHLIEVAMKVETDSRIFIVTKSQPIPPNAKRRETTFLTIQLFQAILAEIDEKSGR